MWQGEILVLYGLKKVFKEQILFIRVWLHLILWLQ